MQSLPEALHHPLYHPLHHTLHHPLYHPLLSPAASSLTASPAASAIASSPTASPTSGPLGHPLWSQRSAPAPRALGNATGSGVAQTPAPSITPGAPGRGELLLPQPGQGAAVLGNVSPWSAQLSGQSQGPEGTRSSSMKHRMATGGGRAVANMMDFS